MNKEMQAKSQKDVFCEKRGKALQFLMRLIKILIGESWAFFAAQSVPHGGTTEQTKDERFETL
ncbi:MAG: hypothetical protein MR849_03810 [Oscillibacter sp.]|jgi:hypothetical protein|nr:hypothetical protein [Oscillibacter sp.]MDY4397031.1 hypothetical protein [Oscillospiraceae bacterium]MDY5016965.1 hypothetical protein [Oscillospiraceae bacterium]